MKTLYYTVVRLYRIQYDTWPIPSKGCRALRPVTRHQHRPRGQRLPFFTAWSCLTSRRLGLSPVTRGHQDTREPGVAQREIFSRIATARGNNHRSCLAVPLCKLSRQPLGTDHEDPDQAQPRPRQPPVARAAATNVGHRGGQGGWPPCSQEIFRI